MSPPPLPELVAPPEGAPGPRLFDLETLSDLRLVVEVPLGSLAVDLRQLLSLRPGSVLPLDTQTGESLEIRANGTTVARGEVRINGEHFAVRVTEIRGAGSPSSEGDDDALPPPEAS